MKINAALERIADLACNIAERSQCMQAHPYFPTPDRLEEMVKLATQMVQMSLDSFVKSDSMLAMKVSVSAFAVSKGMLTFTISPPTVAGPRYMSSSETTVTPLV